MSDRVIPLTPPGPVWSQREYVSCMKLGIAFAAHRHGDTMQAFHYGFPEGIGCTTILVDVNGPVRFIDHDFVKSLDWIERCMKTVGAL